MRLYCAMFDDCCHAFESFEPENVFCCRFFEHFKQNMKVTKGHIMSGDFQKMLLVVNHFLELSNPLGRGTILEQ